MNTTSKYIYNLIAFSQERIDAQNDNYIKGQAKWEILKHLSKEDREAHRRANAAAYIPNSKLFYGKAYRGSWLDLDALLILIAEKPGYICECYYDWLCIERHRIGELDACEAINDKHIELWFKLSSTGDDMEYVAVEKPCCYENTFSFT